MKRKVVYIQRRHPLVVGCQVDVIPLNHSSDWVTNGCWATTTPIKSIAEDGTTFETKNSIYVLAEQPKDEVVVEVRDEAVV